MGDSIYDIYYNDEDMNPDRIVSALESNTGDLTDNEKYWMIDHDPAKYFWEYDNTKESLLKESDELAQKKIGNKKESLVNTAIDTSMDLSHKYGNTNLVTGAHTNTSDSLYQELNISNDRLNSGGKVSRIKTSRKINKLRTNYMHERENQREDYLIQRQEGGIGYEPKEGTNSSTMTEEDDVTIDLGLVDPTSVNPDAPESFSLNDALYAAGDALSDGIDCAFDPDCDTCVLSTAAYRLDLIDKDELMSIVRWRVRNQSKMLFQEQVWLGYQIAFKPIANAMAKSKLLSSTVKRFILSPWISIVNGKANRLFSIAMKSISIMGYLLNRGKARKLKTNLDLIGAKGMFKRYKAIIAKKEGK